MIGLCDVLSDKQHTTFLVLRHLTTAADVRLENLVFKSVKGTCTYKQSMHAHRRQHVTYTLMAEETYG